MAPVRTGWGQPRNAQYLLPEREHRVIFGSWIRSIFAIAVLVGRGDGHRTARRAAIAGRGSTA
ncbi:hypothetical protein Ga0074812_107296 [Parafrankia irregularis]|uniref:Uncharacterized protein n=1 Tax=Parafrankia irregularis TaxID=795642 RepID=A0A0S4QNP3_9ACTN|nr:hypothetical protein Ga0074812_107296 [Parafrankia irregularis]